MTVHRKHDEFRKYNGPWPATCTGCSEPIAQDQAPIIEWLLRCYVAPGKTDGCVLLFHTACAIDFGLGFMRDVYEARRAESIAAATRVRPS